jgi:hypothetical protein
MRCCGYVDGDYESQQYRARTHYPTSKRNSSLDQLPEQWKEVSVINDELAVMVLIGHLDLWWKETAMGLDDGVL